MQKRWGLAGRVVMAAVVLGNALGLAANAAAAVQYHKAAEAMGTASVYYGKQHQRRRDLPYQRPRTDGACPFRRVRAVIQRGCRAAPHYRRVCCSQSAVRPHPQVQAEAVLKRHTTHTTHSLQRPCPRPQQLGVPVDLGSVTPLLTRQRTFHCINVNAYHGSLACVTKSHCLSV